MQLDHLKSPEIEGRKWAVLNQGPGNIDDQFYELFFIRGCLDLG
jgi:hypothetical protein